MSEGVRIRELAAHRTGPAENLLVRPDARLNIMAGPNGSGKSMLLELAWWALTGDPESVSMYCREGAELSTEMNTGETLRARDVEGVWEQKRSGGPPMVRALHFGENGECRVWDPMNSLLDGRNPDPRSWSLFNREELTWGRPGQFEGMLRDLCRWQRKGGREIETFTRTMRELTTQEFSLADPARTPGSVRETPVMRMGDREFPVQAAGSGTFQAMSFAHMILWAWEEHLVQAGLTGEEPLGPPVMMMDTPEAHMHVMPQTKLVRTLMETAGELHGDPGQWLITTHSWEIFYGNPEAGRKMLLPADLEPQED